VVVVVVVLLVVGWVVVVCAVVVDGVEVVCWVVCCVVDEVLGEVVDCEVVGTVLLVLGLEVDWDDELVAEVWVVAWVVPDEDVFCVVVTEDDDVDGIVAGWELDTDVDCVLDEVTAVVTGFEETVLGALLDGAVVVGDDVLGLVLCSVEAVDWDVLGTVVVVEVVDLLVVGGGGGGVKPPAQLHALVMRYVSLPQPPR
jgi:hypothetical protein